MDRQDPSGLAPILRAWGLGEPDGVERLGGSNNTSWRVRDGFGSHVVRIYRNSGNLPHVQHEHILLKHLASVPLSFAVPSPLPSVRGRTLEPIEMDGEIVSASVFPVIPGEHPGDWSDGRRVHAAGAALGELDRALAGIVMPAGMTWFPTYGDLDCIHDAAPDPDALIVELPVAEALKDEFLAFLRSTRERIDALYGALPRQIIHSDLGGSNLLFQDDRVSGILDFEFASLDLRALDLTVAVGLMGPVHGEDVLDLEVVRALAHGYGTMVRLSAAEIEAIPDLMRLRGAVTTIHRAGRWKVGISSLHSVESRIVHNLALERWVAENREALLEALSS